MARRIHLGIPAGVGRLLCTVVEQEKRVQGVESVGIIGRYETAEIGKT